MCTPRLSQSSLRSLHEGQVTNYDAPLALRSDISIGLAERQFKMQELIQETEQL